MATDRALEKLAASGLASGAFVKLLAWYLDALGFATRGRKQEVENSSFQQCTILVTAPI